MILRPELVTPGYIFFAPYRNIDPGPYIYDSRGNLVWSGAGSSGPKTAHAPRVCEYHGEDHLCYFQGEQHQGFARGHGVIMDRNYRIVKTVESSGAGASSDMHEFKLSPYSDGKTALMTVYQPRQYDLTTNPRFNVERGMGWIVEGVFQEVEIDTGRVVFEWRSLDHVDPGLSWTMPGTTDTSGNGLHEQTPWDYFHLNSIDKNAEGDYLLSARHVSAIYKVSGEDGHIIWQMGGNAATIHTRNFVFSYQHHARWISENDTHTILSFYDNASNTFNETNTFSHGRIISIDHVSGEATMIKEWGAPEPEGGLLSGSQGNMQMLPNGGCHIGWGEHAYFSEHTADGSAVMYAKVADRASNVMIYRSNKFNWTAQPLTKPALWTYSRTGEKMASWVSWNGATEVKSWNFYTSHRSNGPWTLAGNAEKDGFETEFHSPNMGLWSYAEALDKDGRRLETSVITRTFQPSESLVEWCDDRGCNYSEPTLEADSFPYEAEVNVPLHYLSPNRGYNTSHYYQELLKNGSVRPGPTSAHAELSHVGSVQADYSQNLPQHGTGNFDTGIILVAVGLLVGFGVSVLGLFLWTRYGSFALADSLFARDQDQSRPTTKSAFGAKFLGSYTMLRKKDMDGLESGSSRGDSGEGDHA